MTSALCLGCGRIKHGALCACTYCHAVADPDERLAIDLSDHRLSVPTLERLGRVIIDLDAAGTARAIRDCAFRLFLREAMKQRLAEDLAPELVPRAREALTGVALPTITIATARCRSVPLDRVVGAAAEPDDALDAIGVQIARIVAEEDPTCPRSDLHIAEVLASEGMNVARRTVARCRERLGILSSSRRRRVDASTDGT